ncbi:MAG: DedA family protein [Nitrosopumilaceae archaeon]
MDFSALFPFAPEVGYLGLTVVNFFASLIPFVPLPSFLLLATMAVGEQFNMHIMVLLFAISATIAKQIIFTASYGGRKIIKEKTRQRLKPFERLVKRYGASAAFVAAATPVPDDLVYVPLGLAKYNPLKFFIATFSGKIVLSYVIVLLSRSFGLSFVEPMIKQVDDITTIYIGIAVFAALITIVIVLMLRLDWEKILGKVAPWTLDPDKDNGS